MRAPHIMSVFSQSDITGYARLCSVFKSLNSNFVPKVIGHSNSLCFIIKFNIIAVYLFIKIILKLIHRSQASMGWLYIIYICVCMQMQYLLLHSM